MSKTIFIPEQIEYLTFEEENPITRNGNLIYLGDAIMLISALLLALTVVVGYTHAELFDITTQIGAHILMILVAASLKAGYVIRLAGERKRALSKAADNRAS